MSTKFTNLFIYTSLAVLALSIFANAMTKPLSHDEQMYTAAGVLTLQGKTIYKDFSYPGHMPYHPLILAALFKLFDTTYYLLTARTLSAISDIITMLCIFYIFRRFLKPLTFSIAMLPLCAAALYVFNPAVDFASGYAWNHNITIALVSLAALLFLRTDKPGSLTIVAVAALLTIASCIRITALLAQICFVISIFLLPAENLKMKLKNLAIFLTASAAMLIYPLYIIAQAVKPFLMNLLLIPQLNGRWQQMVTASVKNPNIASSPLIFITMYLSLVLIALTLLVLLMKNPKNLKFTSFHRPLLPAMLSVVFFIAIWIPPTPWIQYLALPVPFIIISFVFPMAYLKKSSPRKFNTVTAVFALVAFLSVTWNSSQLKNILAIRNPSRWTSVKLHKTAQNIAANTPEPKKILTLSPLYALEGGAEIYTELSAGPFVYRIAQWLSPQQLKITNAVSPENIDLLVDLSLPSGVIVGTEPQSLEKPLIESAVTPRWQRKKYENGITAFLKPQND